MVRRRGEAKRQTEMDPLAKVGRLGFTLDVLIWIDDQADALGGAAPRLIAEVRQACAARTPGRQAAQQQQRQWCGG